MGRAPGFAFVRGRVRPRAYSSRQRRVAHARITERLGPDLVKTTIEEKAYDICGRSRFARREKRAMAQKIVDFMDIPAYGPRFKRRLTEAEKIARRYQDQLHA